MAVNLTPSWRPIDFDETKAETETCSFQAHNAKEVSPAIREGESTERNDAAEVENNQAANDSDAQFGNIIASCLRESNLSKVAKLALQGELLATVARHIK